MLEEMAKIAHTGMIKLNGTPKINEYQAELEEACRKMQIWRTEGTCGSTGRGFTPATGLV